MKGNTNKEKASNKKSFFTKVFEKLDKKIEEKAKSSKSCCSSNTKNNSCCS